MSTKQEFCLFIFALRKAVPRFAPDFSDQETLAIWFEQFERIPADSLALAYKRAIARCDAFPSIRELMGLAGNAIQSDEDVGREVGERIWATLCRFGSQKFDLSAELGPVGVEVVRLQGGWNAICETATYDNAGTLKAQWRELAEVLARKGRSGSLDSLPQFETPGPVTKALEVALAGIVPVGARR